MQSHLIEFGESGSYGFLVGDIEDGFMNGVSVLSCLLSGFGKAISIDVAEDDGCTGIGKSARDRIADPTSRTSYQSRLAGQIKHLSGHFDILYQRVVRRTCRSDRSNTCVNNSVPSPGPCMGRTWPFSMRGSSVTSSLYQPV
ncbi:hypothetical protein D3C80_1457170 [compost metagenome]